jgi:hypothetical protein
VRRADRPATGGSLSSGSFPDAVVIGVEYDCPEYSGARRSAALAGRARA